MGGTWSLVFGALWPSALKAELGASFCSFGDLSLVIVGTESRRNTKLETGLILY